MLGFCFCRLPLSVLAIGGRGPACCLHKRGGLDRLFLALKNQISVPENHMTPLFRVCCFWTTSIFPDGCAFLQALAFRLSGVKCCTIAEVCVLILDVPVVVVVVQERIGARDLSGCVKSIPKRYGTVSDKPSGAECFLQSLVGDDFLGWTFSHLFLRNQYSRHVHNPPAHGHCTIGIWYDHSSISVCVCVCVYFCRRVLTWQLHQQRRTCHRVVVKEEEMGGYTVFSHFKPLEVYCIEERSDGETPLTKGSSSRCPRKPRV